MKRQKKKQFELTDLIPHTILLSEADMKFLLEQCAKPPAPTPALIALMQGKKLHPTCPPHKYIPNTASGIGFCSVCYSDDMTDKNHI